LIIAILLHQFVEGGAVRSRSLELQRKPKRGKQFGELCKTQLPSSCVFQGVERGATDTRLARERGFG
jgi:hypothetical protein